MRFISLFFSLFPILAMGQGFGFSDHVYLSPVPRVPPPPQTPEQLASIGLYERWVASDLPTNTPLSGGWTGRIQQIMWTNGATTVPTNNSANGLWFDATHFFTNNWNIGTTNLTFGFILKLVDINDQFYPPIFYGHGANEGATYGLVFNDASATDQLAIQYTGNFTGIGPDPFSVVNVWFDFWIAQTNHSGIGATLVHTNTVLMGQATLGRFGTDQSSNPFYLFYNNWRNVGTHCWLQELWTWTNNEQIYGIQQDSVRTNFHKYATNRYGYTP